MAHTSISSTRLMDSSLLTLAWADDVTADDRTSLHAVRLAPSSSPTRGVLSFNYLGNSVGGMETSAEDAALLLNVVLRG
ncbi:hypothetical protein F5Y14DRAFT_421084 [Nemania sp. NC0429]|nr:hypothetical protein F5Y14DRAFT_421084 [Nemania sp. NC0429]